MQLHTQNHGWFSIKRHLAKPVRQWRRILLMLPIFKESALPDTIYPMGSFKLQFSLAFSYVLLCNHEYIHCLNHRQAKDYITRRNETERKPLIWKKSMYVHTYQYITICKHTQYWINTNEYSWNHPIFTINLIIGGLPGQSRPSSGTGSSLLDTRNNTYWENQAQHRPSKSKWESMISQKTLVLSYICDLNAVIPTRNVNSHEVKKKKFSIIFLHLLSKKWPELSCHMSGSQEDGQTDTKSK